MVAILVTLVVCLAAIGFGELFFRLININFPHTLDSIIFKIAIGWVGISMYLFLLGVMGRFQLELVWGFIAILAMTGIWFLFKWLISINWNQLSLPKLTHLEWLVGVPAIGLFLFIFITSLAPPTGSGMGWDELSYHLPTIKTYIEHNRILLIADRVQSNYPMGMDILFAPGMMLDQISYPHLLHFFMGILAVFAISSLFIHLGNRTVAFLLPPLFLSITLVQDEATWAMVDLGVTLYSCLALISLVYWQETKILSWLLITGIIAGFALSIKLTALLGIVALGVLLLVLLIKDKTEGFNHLTTSLLTFLIPLIIIGSPWYIKSYILTGNPFLPYFYNIFGGITWSPQANERYMSYMNSSGLNLPYFLLVGGSISCLLVAGIIAFKSKYQLAIKILATFTLLWFALFLISGSPQKRFLLPLIPVMLALVLWFISTNFRQISFWRSFLYGLVALVLVISLGSAVQTKKDMLNVVFGQESKEEYLGRMFSQYDPYQFVNTELSGSDKIFVFPDNRTFYLNRPYILGDPIDQVFINYSKYNTPNDLFKSLRSLGVTHIMVQNPTFEFFRQLHSHNPESVAYLDHAMQLINNIDTNYLIKVYDIEGVEIYALDVN